MKLVRRLAEEGIACRTVTVGSTTVEIAPQRMAITPQPREELAPTYAQRAMDRLGKKLVREGGLKE